MPSLSRFFAVIPRMCMPGSPCGEGVKREKKMFPVLLSVECVVVGAPCLLPVQQDVYSFRVFRVRLSCLWMQEHVGSHLFRRL